MFHTRALKIIFTMLTVLALTACGLMPKPPVSYDTTVLVPQDNLLQDCPVAPPPDKEDFLFMTSDEKIYALSLAYNQQTLNVGLCNKDKSGLRLWKKDELKKLKGKIK